MLDYIDCAGASGAQYRFFNVKDGRPQSMAGGGYIYVKLDGVTPTILFAGETDNLFMGAVDRWSEAVDKYGATHLYTRLNVSGQTRRSELKDILGAHRPTMNPGLAAPAVAEPDVTAEAAETAEPAGEAPAEASETTEPKKSARQRA